MDRLNKLQWSNPDHHYIYAWLERWRKEVDVLGGGDPRAGAYYAGYHDSISSHLKDPACQRGVYPYFDLYLMGWHDAQGDFVTYLDTGTWEAALVRPVS